MTSCPFVSFVVNQFTTKNMKGRKVLAMSETTRGKGTRQ